MGTEDGSSEKELAVAMQKRLAEIQQLRQEMGELSMSLKVSQLSIRDFQKRLETQKMKDGRSIRGWLVCRDGSYEGPFGLLAAAEKLAAQKDPESWVLRPMLKEEGVNGQ